MGVNNRLESHEHFVQRLVAVVTHEDAGKRKVLGELPAGAVILRAMAVVTEAFNGSGTDLIDIGTAKATDLTEIDYDGLAANLDVSTVGAKINTTIATSGEVWSSTPVAVTCDYADASGNADTGRAVVVVEAAIGLTNV